MTPRYHVQYHRKNDGRALYLYSWDKADRQPVILADPPPYPPVSFATGTLDWHPLKQTWINTAPNRQDRTFRPAVSACPLCPSPNGHTEHGSTEIPFTDFELAVFDNRFPAFVPADQAAALPNAALHPAHGKCEVVVYSPDHQAFMGSLDQARRELLVEAWVHRYDTLLGLPDIQFVLPFENRGEALGATLSHPHGQIYGFPFLPLLTEKIAQSFAKDPALLVKTVNSHGALILAEDTGLVAFCPRFGEFSYEIWIAPREPRSGLWTFDRGERQALARLMGRVARVYNRLFDQPMPYVMAVQSAPPRFEKSWHSHVTFQPFLRTSDKLKYLAGVEVTAGHYLKDVPADTAFAILKPLFEGETP